MRFPGDVCDLANRLSATQRLEDRYRRIVPNVIRQGLSVDRDRAVDADVDMPWKRAVVAAGLDPSQLVRHTLRHTAVTHIVQAGVDLPTVEQISGHKTLTMVESYSHQNGELV